MEPPLEKPAPGRGNRPFYWALGVAAAGVFAAAGYALAQPLGDADTVRGAVLLIVTLAAVAVALVLVLSAVLQSRSSGARRGFARGREVLLPLAGILGTIVGYSLGRDGGGRPAEAPLTVVSRIDPAVAGNEAGWALATTFIDGGTPPFNYRLAVKGAVEEPISGRTHARLLQQPVRRPAAAATLVTTVTDARGQRAEAVVPLGFADGQAEAPAPALADGDPARVEPSVAYGQPVLQARVSYDADGRVDAVEFSPDTPTTLPLVYFGRRPLDGPARLLAHVLPEGAAGAPEGWVTEPVTVHFRGSGASVEFSAAWNVETNFRAALVAVLMERLNRSTAADRLLVDAVLVVGEHDGYSLPGLLTIEIAEAPPPQGPVVAPPVEQQEGAAAAGRP